jgi:hypothetical protein
MTSLWFLARMCRIVSGQETPEWSNIPDSDFPASQHIDFVDELEADSGTHTPLKGRAEWVRGSSPIKPE